MKKKFQYISIKKMFLLTSIIFLVINNSYAESYVYLKNSQGELAGRLSYSQGSISNLIRINSFCAYKFILEGATCEYQGAKAAIVQSKDPIIAKVAPASPNLGKGLNGAVADAKKQLQDSADKILANVYNQSKQAAKDSSVPPTPETKIVYQVIEKAVVIQGPAGPAGPQGPQGEAGSAGATGISGSAGGSGSISVINASGQTMQTSIPGEIYQTFVKLLSADQFTANFATFQDLVTNNFTATTSHLFNASTTNADIINLSNIFATTTNSTTTNAYFLNSSTSFATTSTFFANTATITTLYVNYASLTNATTTLFFAGNSTTTNLFANNASITNATTSLFFANNATITNVYINYATLSEATATLIYANQGIFDNIIVRNATISNSTTTNATSTNSSSTNFFSVNSQSINGSSTNLIVGFATLTNASATNLYASNASITSINVAFGTITNSSSTNLFASIANFLNAYINTLFGNNSNFITSNASTSNATTSNFNTSNAITQNSTTINATTTNSNTTNSQTFNGTNLNATGTSQLTSVYASTSNASSSIIVNATLTNATATNLFATNAKLTNVDVTFGTITNSTSTNFFTNFANIVSAYITTLFGTTSNFITSNASTTNATTSNTVTGNAITFNATTINATTTNSNTTNSQTFNGTNLNATGTSQLTSVYASTSNASSSIIVNATLTNATATNLFVSNFQAGLTNGYVWRGNTANVNEATSSLFISNAGNVGIGNTAPNNKLEITSAAAGTSGLRLTNLLSTSATSTSNGKALTVNATGDLVLVDSTNCTNSFCQNGNTFGTNGVLGTLDGFAQTFLTNGTEKVRIDTAGNVGIGTNAPGVKLDVRGSIRAIGNTTGVFQMYDTTTVSNYGTFYKSDGTTPIAYIGGAAGAAVGGGTANDFTIRAPSGNLLLYPDTGNVGIGTTAPGNKLEITSALGGTSGLRFTNLLSTSATTTSNGKALTVNASGDVVLVEAGTCTTTFCQSGNAFGTNAILGTTDAFAQTFITSNTERMRIGATGNVGIGTTAPDYKLDVNGDTNMFGRLVIGADRAASYGDGNLSVLTNATNVGIDLQANASGNSVLRFVDNTYAADIGSISASGTSTKINGIGGANIVSFTTGTSTFVSSGGTNLTAGCYAINNVCIGVSTANNNIYEYTQTAFTTTSGSPTYTNSALSTMASQYTQPYGLVRVGNYMYVANNGEDTISVYDISNPTAPSLVGSFVTGCSITGLAASADGSTLYVTDYVNNNFKIFNLTASATNPPFVSALATGGTYPIGIAVSAAGYLYIANNASSCIGVYNISTPQSPVFSSCVAVATSPVGVIANGTSLYVTYYISNLFRVYDISTPTALTLGASVATGFGPTLMAIKNNILYVSNYSANTISTFTVSTPSAPTALSSFSAGGTSPAGLAFGPGTTGYFYGANNGANTITTYKQAQDSGSGVLVGTSGQSVTSSVFTTFQMDKALYVKPSLTQATYYAAPGSAGTSVRDAIIANGSVRARGFVVDTTADLAESFPSAEGQIPPGTLVSFSTETVDWNPYAGFESTANPSDTYRINKVKTASGTDEIVGIISTSPGFLLGGDKGVPVAFSGRVPVLVTDEAGTIKRGDKLTLSITVPGKAMKLDAAEGFSVGTAMSDDIGNGKVLVLVEQGYSKKNLRKDFVAKRKGAFVNSSTSSSSIDISNISFRDLFNEIMDKVANLANEVVTNVLKTQILCVGKYCVNENQFGQIMQSAGVDTSQNTESINTGNTWNNTNTNNTNNSTTTTATTTTTTTSVETSNSTTTIIPEQSTTVTEEIQNTATTTTN